MNVDENGDYWAHGCRWVVVITNGVVTTSDVDPSSTSTKCQPIDCTVESPHAQIARWLADVDALASQLQSRDQLEVLFDEAGVPIEPEYDLASKADEEWSMQITITLAP